jgi:hypothetical protein
VAWTPILQDGEVSLLDLPNLSEAKKQSILQFAGVPSAAVKASISMQKKF